MTKQSLIPTSIFARGHKPTEAELQFLHDEVLRLVTKAPRTLNELCSKLHFSRTTVTKHCKMFEQDGDMHCVTVKRRHGGGEHIWTFGPHPDPAIHAAKTAQHNRIVRAQWEPVNVRDDFPLHAAFFGRAA